MAYKIDEKKCIKCGACSGICPVNAITLKKGIYTIDPKKCVSCGMCASVCPVEAPSEQ